MGSIEFKSGFIMSVYIEYRYIYFGSKLNTFIPLKAIELSLFICIVNYVCACAYIFTDILYSQTPSIKHMVRGMIITYDV